MSRVHYPVLGLLAAMSFGVTSASAAETVSLDLRDARNLSTSATAAAQSSPLVVGESYVVTVTGTGGTFAPQRYPATGTCGVADAQPMFPSPGAPVTPAGWDAQTVYAAPIDAVIGPDLGRACNNTVLPAHVSPVTYSGFKIAVGTAPYSRPQPVGGNRSVPRTDHKYSYTFVGTGDPLNFRFADGPVSDNSGVFSIVVRTAAECAAVSCLADAGAEFDHPVQIAQSGGTVDPDKTSVAGVSVCSTDRVLSVRVVQPKGVTLSKTVYYIGGVKTRTVSGKKIFIGKTKTIRAQKFKRLPVGPIKLRIDFTTTKNKKFTVSKEFARCQPRKKARPVSPK